MCSPNESLAECDPVAADAIWERSGLAIPLQINFAVSGAARIIREIRAALHRREREQATALQSATASIEKELKNTVSGLLLQSQLALSQSGVPTVVAEKLRLVADLAGTLRQQLSAPPQSAKITAATVSRNSRTATNRTWLSRFIDLDTLDLGEPESGTPDLGGKGVGG